MAKITLDIFRFDEATDDEPVTDETSGDEPAASGPSRLFRPAGTRLRLGALAAGIGMLSLGAAGVLLLLDFTNGFLTSGAHSVLSAAPLALMALSWSTATCCETMPRKTRMYRPRLTAWTAEDGSKVLTTRATRRRTAGSSPPASGRERADQTGEPQFAPGVVGGPLPECWARHGLSVDDLQEADSQGDLPGAVQRGNGRGRADPWWYRDGQDLCRCRHVDRPQHVLRRHALALAHPGGEVMRLAQRLAAPSSCGCGTEWGDRGVIGQVTGNHARDPSPALTGQSGRMARHGADRPEAPGLPPCPVPGLAG